MQYTIMVVDDSQFALELVEAFLTEHRYDVKSYSSPTEALGAFGEHRFDCVLSDFFMPEMNGDRFFREIKVMDPEIPFIFMSTNEDIRVAIELMRMGADDYITKPIIKDALLFRIEKNLKEYENRRVLDNLNRKQEIREISEEQLVNWRKIAGTENGSRARLFSRLFSRTFPQAGPFLIGDILRDQIEEKADGTYSVNGDLARALFEAGNQQEHIREQMEFINSLDNISFKTEKTDCQSFAAWLDQLARGALSALASKYGRRLCGPGTEVNAEGSVVIDTEYLGKILTELTINAVKYSQENTDIELLCEQGPKRDNSFLSVILKNTARTGSVRDVDGGEITGIPLGYSELVFDRFYKLDNAAQLDEEEWTGGSGLYISRKILKAQNGRIRAFNSISFRDGRAKPFVQVCITLPITD